MGVLQVIGSEALKETVCDPILSSFVFVDHGVRSSGSPHSPHDVLVYHKLETREPVCHELKSANCRPK